MNTFAILDQTGGWLVNLVLWDGNPGTWSPPQGSIAVPAAQVDFNSLPPPPQP
jgi:hypothetical protein